MLGDLGITLLIACWVIVIAVPPLHTQSDRRESTSIRRFHGGLRALGRHYEPVSRMPKLDRAKYRKRQRTLLALMAIFICGLLSLSISVSIGLALMSLSVVFAAAFLAMLAAAASQRPSTSRMRGAVPEPNHFHWDTAPEQQQAQAG